MDGNETTIRVCLIVLTGFVTLIGGCVIDSTNDTRAIAEMVKAGADPQEAACAVNGINRSHVVCAILAAQKK